MDERTALPAAEGVLLRSMRAWVLARCRAEDLQVEKRIEAALGGLDAAEAGCGLCGFMGAVERGGTRPVTVERMCARQLTPDERALRGMMAPTSVGTAPERAADVALALAGAAHALVAGEVPAAARLH